MTDLKCSYCKETFDNHDHVIRHSITAHQEHGLSFITVAVEKTCVKYKRRVFHKKNKDISCHPNDVSFNQVSGKVDIQNKTPTKSPVRKMCKLNTPSKSVHKKLFEGSEIGPYNESTSPVVLTEQHSVDEPVSAGIDDLEMDIDNVVEEVSCDVNEIEDEELLTENAQVKESEKGRKFDKRRRI